jgi:hypothetical protein
MQVQNKHHRFTKVGLVGSGLILGRSRKNGAATIAA